MPPLAIVPRLDERREHSAVRLATRSLLLGAAYSRACEYACDRVGERCAPEGALSGLLVLAAGKELHGSVDIREFSEQADTHGGFWVVLAELFASHPHLSKRVQALLRAGVPVQRSPQRPMYAAAPLNDMSLVP